MATGLRMANVLMALLFALGAAVQYNDPDPLRWMAIYLAAAAVCVLAALDRAPWQLPAALGGAALAWAATLVSRVVGTVAIGDLFAAWEMESAGVEEGREMYGLLIIAAWMAVLAIVVHRRARLAGAGSR